jgi:small subunit ribosomal protein S11
MGKKVSRTTTKKRKVIVEPFGNVYIKATFNNVIVSITNTSGHVIAWSSAGKMGFKGSKKNTPYAAQRAAEDCAKVAYDLGMRKATVFVKGPGTGRDAAVRVINNMGIEVTSITDTTPIPHNGCRPPKRRRV